MLHAQQLRVTDPWIAGVMRDLSGLGSTVVLALFAFKLAFGRPRPDPAFSGYLASGLSFPRGHASMSAIVFLTLGVLVASTRERWSERAYILAVSTVLTLLVGVSRVVLGVHWASDVLGGWAFGTAWAMAWLILARRTAA